MVRERAKMISYSLITLFGVCVFFIGAGSLFGYAIGLEGLSAWFGDTKMSGSTSVCMAVIGISLFLIGLDNVKK